MMDDPLFNPGWIQFNEVRWGLKAIRIVLGPKKGTSWELETIIYRNKNGELVQPPRTPHLPVDFSSTSDRPFAMNRRKRLAIEELAGALKKFNFSTDIKFSHIVNDVRPFLWQGFVSIPQYTFLIDLSSYNQNADPKAINIVRKASKLGYTCETTHDFDIVARCQHAPYSRQGLRHYLKVDELRLIYKLVGDQGISAFLCRDAKGNPIGASIHFFVPGGWALDWSSGVETSALKDGANYLLNDFVINYYYKKQCILYDFAGANIPPIAAGKEAWGGNLVCYFAIRQPSFRNFLRRNIKQSKRFVKKKAREFGVFR